MYKPRTCLFGRIIVALYISDVIRHFKTVSAGKNGYVLPLVLKIVPVAFRILKVFSETVMLKEGFYIAALTVAYYI